MPAAGCGGQVELGGRARQHADGGAVHVGDRPVARVGPHHHPLAVVERGGQEAAAPVPSRVAVKVVLRISTSMSPACNAVAGLGAERDVLDRLGVAQHRGRHRLAELDVEAGVVARLVDQAEAGHGLVHAAAQRAPVLDLAQEAAATAAFLLAPGLAAVVVTAAIVVAAGSAEQAERDQQGGQPPTGRSSDHRGSPCRCRERPSAAHLPVRRPPPVRFSAAISTGRSAHAGPVPSSTCVTSVAMGCARHGSARRGRRAGAPSATR